jgi:hypothetical protein
MSEPWDGVPPNPDKSGWHWLMPRRGDQPWPARWSDDDGGPGDFGWEMGDDDGAPDIMARYFRYLCPLPDPVIPADAAQQS